MATNWARNATDRLFPQPAKGAFAPVAMEGTGGDRVLGGGRSRFRVESKPEPSNSLPLHDE